MLLAMSNRRVLFHIAPSRCLCMHDVFGQRHLTTETCCKVWTQETHCSCSRHVPRRVPRPCPCTTGVMKSRTNHLFAITHAAEAATQETHCSCTRHVPRHVPCPCPVHNKCNEMKNRSFICNHSTEDTLQLHKARTKAPASSMPVHNRCNEMKNTSVISTHVCS